MPSIRLLDLANLVALSPSKHFFNGLLDPSHAKNAENRLVEG